MHQLALDLINRDRATHGVAPVVMGSNPAAQMHAQDMIDHDYQGHWWANGMKPYMMYSITGGTSYVSENAASSGWTARRWWEQHCDSITASCHVPSPEEAVEELHWRMMYDDADANWGHRQNILRSSHRKVNIGIASNSRRVTFVQHFEGGDVEAVSSPTLAGDGTFSLQVAKNVPGIQIGQVASIYYDPSPARMPPEQIDALDSYCLGGGTTTSCGDPVIRILPPPGPGSNYSQLDGTEVVANLWEETNDSFQVSANIGHLITRPGVYTVTLWNNSDSSRLTDQMLALTIISQQ